MYPEIVPVVLMLPVNDPVVSEWDIADGHVEEVVLKTYPLVAVYRYIRFLVELAGNPARYAVQLHAVEFGLLHALRQYAEEVACAAGRLKDIPF